MQRPFPIAWRTDNSVGDLVHSNTFLGNTRMKSAVLECISNIDVAVGSESQGLTVPEEEERLKLNIHQRQEGASWWGKEFI